MATLKIYKLAPEVVIPRFATEEAACFDLSYQPWGKAYYSGYTAQNAPFKRPVPPDIGSLRIMPGERILAPTGLIFDIPKGYSLRIHPRSGMALKLGISLCNCEGVVDSDYFHETFIALINYATIFHDIQVGERLAQAELVKLQKYDIEETLEQPTQKTDRVGGFGSTGTTDVVQKTLDSVSKI